ncbi:hypothetical protein M0R88_01040 [Halorussus gelatinilyticus]|uniref:Uncharacterized protein n=1 Tax=Halorussus gelatinilyticus TaxID=2937524 RepID=A0A8U0IK64_9EURY|nr:hypothetical protein [Halorussus gelatinilyticus]UPW00702.1 hypothetical protein M0R88_01040 [Halorussus gelatinilyticus]
MPESIYSVYLVQRHGEQGGKREVTSPVPGHELEFYDTGVWLAREAGRNFFPYEQIRTIREHPEGRRDEQEGTAEARTPEGGSGDGESSAEEEMLED